MIDFTSIEFDSSNPEPRCPCILLLDVSGSMSGNPIAELNTGLQAFQESLLQDELASLRVEVAIITFGDGVKIAQDFVTANQFVPPTLHASAATPMGAAINLSLDKLDERKRIYKQNGISFYRPWIFLITDGAPTDTTVWTVATQRVREAEVQKKVAFFAVGVQGADMNILQQITPREPLRLVGLNFRDMFIWLSSSLTTVSQSKPDDAVPLQAPTGWAMID
jgi:uncharacterized protein YegL